MFLCLCQSSVGFALIYAWKFQQENTFIFVTVRFISLSKNRLILTKKQSDCQMASKGGAYPYRRKYVKFQHCVEIDKGTNYRLYKCSFRVHCYGSAYRWSRRQLLQKPNLFHPSLSVAMVCLGLLHINFCIKCHLCFS